MHATSAFVNVFLRVLTQHSMQPFHFGYRGENIVWKNPQCVANENSLLLKSWPLSVMTSFGVSSIANMSERRAITVGALSNLVLMRTWYILK